MLTAYIYRIGGNTMIKILTLGDFDILINDRSILEEVVFQKRLIRLFKYFLVHNEIKLLPENIIEDLWGSDDFKNPINLLRTQISRLRTMIDYDKFDIEPFFTIKYVNGYYIFKLDENCLVDFIEFEKAFDKDVLSLKNQIQGALLDYREMLLLYKGKFLEELDEEDWLIPIRSRFGRLYIRAISCYIDYLKEQGMYTEIVSICEIAIKIKPYNEMINLNFMEALVKLNQESYALIHYDFFTRKLYNDLGEKPSRKIIELYKEIRIKESKDYSNLDLNSINSEMVKGFELDKVEMCDLHYFKFLYTYEKLNKARNLDKNAGIGIITIESDTHKELSSNELKEGMELLISILFKSLWVGDVFTKWNDCQILMLLYDLKEENIGTVINNIKRLFNSSKTIDNLSLNIKIKIIE